MKNRTLVGIIAIALAAILVFVAAPLINSMSSEKMEVIQLKTAVPEGKLITADDITVVEIGKLGVPNSVITKESAVVGKYAASPLYPNTNLYPNMFTANDTSATNVLANLDKDHVAISVTLKSFASGVSAKIQNGDIVSVIVTDSTGTFIPEALKYMKVISTTTDSGLDTDQISAADDSVPSPVTVTLYATAYQAKLLATYESRAVMHFALACRADSPNAVEFTKEQEAALSKITDKTVKVATTETTQPATSVTSETSETSETGGEDNG